MCKQLTSPVYLKKKKKKTRSLTTRQRPPASTRHARSTTLGKVRQRPLLAIFSTARSVPKKRCRDSLWATQQRLLHKPRLGRKKLENYLEKDLEKILEIFLEYFFYRKLLRKVLRKFSRIFLRFFSRIFFTKFSRNFLRKSLKLIQKGCAKPVPCRFESCNKIWYKPHRAREIQQRWHPVTLKAPPSLERQQHILHALKLSRGYLVLTTDVRQVRVPPLSPPPPPLSACNIKK